MFDDHLNRQHRLTYFVRGPEWAFAVPQGDLHALAGVMQGCSTRWNGVGSLLVPVRADGRMSATVKQLLKIRPVDACYMHEGLGNTARAAVEKLAGGVPLWDRFDRDELHPLDLLGPGGERQVERVMEPPRFDTVGLRRAALAIWGHLQDEDAPYWQDRYQVSERNGADAHGALLRGQIEGQSASPLRLTALHMDTVRQVNPLDRPYIWVIGRPTFDNLVNFWNFRARALAWANGSPVIGLPRESLQHPDQLSALTRWMVRYPSMRRRPDVLVACMSEVQDDVQSVLSRLPLVEDTDTGIGEDIGVGFAPNDPATFRLTRPILGGPFIRGTSSTALVAFADGRSSLTLPTPEKFPVRSFSHARLVFRNLPLPLPVTPSAARTVHRDAQAGDGVMLLTTAPEQWNFDIHLPPLGKRSMHGSATTGSALSAPRTATMPTPCWPDSVPSTRSTSSPTSNGSACSML